MLHHFGVCFDFFFYRDSCMQDFSFLKCRLIFFIVYCSELIIIHGQMLAYTGPMIENEDHDRGSIELPGQQGQIIRDALTFSGKKI